MGGGESGDGVPGVGETQEEGGRSVDTESSSFPEAGTLHLGVRYGERGTDSNHRQFA